MISRFSKGENVVRGLLLAGCPQKGTPLVWLKAATLNLALSQKVRWATVLITMSFLSSSPVTSAGLDRCKQSVFEVWVEGVDRFSTEKGDFPKLSLQECTPNKGPDTSNTQYLAKEIVRWHRENARTAENVDWLAFAFEEIVGSFVQEKQEHPNSLRQLSSHIKSRLRSLEKDQAAKDIVREYGLLESSWFATSQNEPGIKTVADKLRRSGKLLEPCETVFQAVISLSPQSALEERRTFLSVPCDIRPGPEDEMANDGFYQWLAEVYTAAQDPKFASAGAALFASLVDLHRSGNHRQSWAALTKGLEEKLPSYDLGEPTEDFVALDELVSDLESRVSAPPSRPKVPESGGSGVDVAPTGPDPGAPKRLWPWIILGILCLANLVVLVRMKRRLDEVLAREAADLSRLSEKFITQQDLDGATDKLLRDLGSASVIEEMCRQLDGVETKVARLRGELGIQSSLELAGPVETVAERLAKVELRVEQLPDSVPAANETKVSTAVTLPPLPDADPPPVGVTEKVSTDRPTSAGGEIEGHLLQHEVDVLSAQLARALDPPEAKRFQQLVPKLAQLLKPLVEREEDADLTATLQKTYKRVRDTQKLIDPEIHRALVRHKKSAVDATVELREAGEDLRELRGTTFDEWLLHNLVPTVEWLYQVHFERSPRGGALQHPALDTLAKFVESSSAFRLVLPTVGDPLEPSWQKPMDRIRAQLPEQNGRIHSLRRPAVMRETSEGERRLVRRSQVILWQYEG